jgi:hypothetical protein
MKPACTEYAFNATVEAWGFSPTINQKKELAL